MFEFLVQLDGTVTKRYLKTEKKDLNYVLAQCCALFNITPVGAKLKVYIESFKEYLECEELPAMGRLLLEARVDSPASTIILELQEPLSLTPSRPDPTEVDPLKFDTR